MKDTDDGKTASDALEAFFLNFGNIDIYTQIVLEEFFKELYDDEKLSVHIHGEIGQKGD